MDRLEERGPGEGPEADRRPVPRAALLRRLRAVDLRERPGREHAPERLDEPSLPRHLQGQRRRREHARVRRGLPLQGGPAPRPRGSLPDLVKTVESFSLKDGRIAVASRAPGVRPLPQARKRQSKVAHEEHTPGTDSQPSNATRSALARSGGRSRFRGDRHGRRTETLFLEAGAVRSTARSIRAVRRTNSARRRPPRCRARHDPGRPEPDLGAGLSSGDDDPAVRQLRPLRLRPLLPRTRRPRAGRKRQPLLRARLAGGIARREQSRRREHRVADIAEQRARLRRRSAHGVSRRVLGHRDPRGEPWERPQHPDEAPPSHRRLEPRDPGRSVHPELRCVERQRSRGVGGI